MRIGKALIIKTIMFLALATFVFSDISYSMAAISHSNLRVWVDNPEDDARMEDEVEALSLKKDAHSSTAAVKILLVNIVDKDKIAPAYPIGLYTLKTYMQNNSPVPCEVEIKDVHFDDLADIVVFAEEWKPDIMGSSVKTENMRVFDDFMNLLLSSAMPKPKIHAVGKHVATFGYKALLEKYPEVVCVRGEGELALAGLASVVAGEKDLADVNNLAYIDDATDTLVETERKVLPSFEPIGLINHGDAERYVSAKGDFWMEASRNCPWQNCRHCSIKEFWGSSSRREKPVGMIIAELKQAAAMGIERLTFSDEEFIGFGMQGFKRAQEIARTIIANDIKVSFHLDMRAASIWNISDTVEERQLRIDTLRLLKQAGLKTIFTGIETGSPTQLKRHNKGSDVRTAEEAIKRCREVGVNMAIGFIMIDPLVSKQEILESIAFIRRNKILPNMSVPLNRLRLYPGIPYIEFIRKEEESLGRRLISDDFDINTLTYEVVDYKHPVLKVIAGIVTRYAESEYDFFNSIRWFERFNPHIFGVQQMDEYAYIKEAAEKSKEYQIEFLYQLASLTDEELLQTQKPTEILRESVISRDKFIKELKDTILQKGHTEECKGILLQIEKYFSAVPSFEGLIRDLEYVESPTAL